MRDMRRKDREVSGQEIIDIIHKQDVCRLAMVDQGVPYIVPLNFGYQTEGTKLELYFHCANEGRKLDILRKNPTVCFELDGGHRFLKGNSPCQYSFAFESVIGTGEVEFIEDREEKAAALGIIIERFGPDPDFVYPEAMISGVTVFKVIVKEVKGKRRLPG